VNIFGERIRSCKHLGETTVDRSTYAKFTKHPYDKLLVLWMWQLWQGRLPLSVVKEFDHLKVYYTMNLHSVLKTKEGPCYLRAMQDAGDKFKEIDYYTITYLPYHPMNHVSTIWFPGSTKRNYSQMLADKEVYGLAINTSVFFHQVVQDTGLKPDYKHRIGFSIEVLSRDENYLKKIFDVCQEISEMENLELSEDELKTIAKAVACTNLAEQLQNDSENIAKLRVEKYTSHKAIIAEFKFAIKNLTKSASGLRSEIKGYLPNNIVKSLDVEKTLNKYNEMKKAKLLSIPEIIITEELEDHPMPLYRSRKITDGYKFRIRYHYKLTIKVEQFFDDHKVEFTDNKFKTDYNFRIHLIPKAVREERKRKERFKLLLLIFSNFRQKKQYATSTSFVQRNKLTQFFITPYYILVSKEYRIVRTGRTKIFGVPNNADIFFAPVQVLIQMAPALNAKSLYCVSEIVTLLNINFFILKKSVLFCCC